MNKERNIKRGIAGSCTVFLVILIAILVITFNAPKPTLEQTIDPETGEKTWTVLWRGSLASAHEMIPAAGNSSWLGIYYINHTNTPATAYDTNDSGDLSDWANVSGYGYAIADEFDIELSYLLTFDIVCRARWNRTHAWNGTAFRDDDIRINITHTGLNGMPMADVTGTLVITQNNSGQQFIWANVYWNESHAAGGNIGFDISKNAASADNQCTEISIEARF